ncbi:MAG: ABC transporter permease [Lachnospiraceae bacterium]|nr:ABC transporter permease [Lachnospiraceae bacterium]
MTETENYLVVANSALVTNVFGTTPYEVWIKSSDSADTIDYINSKLVEEGRVLDSYITLDGELETMSNSPVIQITNGLFTINFLLSVILSVLGFLIFQITETRDRQTSFGIYRAMGISMKEVNRMIFAELSGIFLTGIAAGALSGMLTTVFFINIFATVYMPDKHNIPVEIYVDISDMIRLGVIFLAVFALTVFIIRRIIRNLRVTEVLKLGED